MGYLWGKDYLGKAMRVVGEKGIVHYHEACHKEECSTRPFERVKSAGRREERSVHVLATRKIKSYSPNIYHVVVDAEVG
jgi:tRNA wybutosine-synthesizing protein 2